MKNTPIPRLDQNAELRNRLTKFCRLKPGQIWEDPLGKHRVGCLDCSLAEQVSALMTDQSACLAVHDPPYNLVAFDVRSVDEYIRWCHGWIAKTYDFLSTNSAMYVWLG